MRLYFAWIISLLALFGSLYYGEVLQVEPCRLCWLQRFALFPLALLLGISVYQNSQKIALYSLPLALLGALFALYHFLLQFFPSLKVGALCDGSCTVSYMPFLSLVAFVLIAILILRNSKKQ